MVHEIVYNTPEDGRGACNVDGDIISLLEREKELNTCYIGYTFTYHISSNSLKENMHTNTVCYKES